MPMIDISAVAGTFSDASKQKLAQDAAATLMRLEKVPPIAMFKSNTAAFIHDIPVISNVNGESNYVRVQVLTNAGALDRERQLAVVKELTELVAAAAADPGLKERTWVLLTEAAEGGWGLWGHAYTNAELVAEVRKQLSA